ncbi:MAG: EamA family transporter [Holophaga sp.]|nr:EamA family transporter [Holophaga sp.]
MFLFALLLVLSSACLHALWNALLKRARDMQTASVGILAVSVLITATAMPWIKGPIFPGRAALLWALGAGLGEGCYFVTLSRALRSAPLGWSYAWMRGVGMLLVWPVSILAMGEAFHLLSAVAVAVVCLGLAVMGLGSSRGRGFGAFFWAGTTGVFIAGYTLCYKCSLAGGAHPVGLYGVAMLVALPVQVAIITRGQGLKAALLPSQWGLVLAAGVLCAGSFLFYLEALAMEGAGIMATLRNTSIVFAVLFSRLIGERPGSRQWAGAALITAGAVGLAWPR